MALKESREDPTYKYLTQPLKNTDSNPRNCSYTNFKKQEFATFPEEREKKRYEN